MNVYQHRFNDEENVADAEQLAAATYAAAEEYDGAAFTDYDQAFFEQQQHEELLQQELNAQALEAMPDVVRNFVTLFHQALSQRAGHDVRQLYEQTFNKLSDRFYQKEPWPDAELVAPLAQHDQVFLTLYEELCYRHVYAKLYPTIEQRFLSYNNYCALFNYILNSEGPVDLELPSQWLWDIIDEFIYQYESFCRFRSRTDRLSEDEIRSLQENPQIWNTYSVLNVLYSLVQKSQINEQLQAMKNEMDPNEVAGEYGSQSLYKILGYFSIIGLLRVHCLLGDYTVALKMMHNIDLNKKALFTRVTACHVSTYYYIGFAYMMMGRYMDAIKTFGHILVFISRARQFNTHSYQYDQISKKTEQMYALLAICISLCPTRLDEAVHSLLREKQGEHLNKMQKGEEGLESFQELFLYACPKFITPNPPDYEIKPAVEKEEAEPEGEEDKDEAEKEEGGEDEDEEKEQRNAPETTQAYQCKIFLGQIRHQIRSATVRSYLKLCTTLPVEKLASFLDMDPEELRKQLLILKVRSRQTRWVDGPLIDGERVAISDLDFCLKQDSIQIAEHKTGRRYGDWFLRNIAKFGDLLAKADARPPLN